MSCVFQQVDNMLSNIDELLIVAAIAVCFTAGYAMLVQYSRYTAHKKAHWKDEDPDKVAMSSRFAVIPYMIIPLVFVGLSVFCGLTAADYAFAAGWMKSDIGIPIWSAAASLAVYILADYGLVRHVGDAVYFDTIESRFHKAAEQVVLSNDEVKLAVEEFLKNRKV